MSASIVCNDGTEAGTGAELGGPMRVSCSTLPMPKL
jgi:hypothetical protein